MVIIATIKGFQNCLEQKTFLKDVVDVENKMLESRQDILDDTIIEKDPWTMYPQE